jgi:hypothetical protein
MYNINATVDNSKVSYDALLNIENETLIFPFLCPGDFSEMAGQIFLKLSGKMHYINTSGSFFICRKFTSGRYRQRVLDEKSGIER